MMISPDTYYEINLKGKDKEYILSAVREISAIFQRLLLSIQTGRMHWRFQEIMTIRITSMSSPKYLMRK